MKRIEYEMRKRGVTQTVLAEMAKCNRTSISRIIRGHEPPYPKRGQRIAEALGWQDDWHELFQEIEVVNHE